MYSRFPSYRLWAVCESIFSSFLQVIELCKKSIHLTQVEGLN